MWWGVDLMAINTKGSFTSQSLPLAFTYFLSMPTMVWLARSTCPDDWGWLATWNFASTPSISHKAVITVAVKWVPRSESMDKGRPQQLKTWLTSKMAVVSAVTLGAGRHSTHLVKAELMVRRYFLPLEDFVDGADPVHFEVGPGKGDSPPL